MGKEKAIKKAEKLTTSLASTPWSALQQAVQVRRRRGRGQARGLPPSELDFKDTINRTEEAAEEEARKSFLLAWGGPARRSTQVANVSFLRRVAGSPLKDVWWLQSSLYGKTKASSPFLPTYKGKFPNKRVWS